MTPRASALSTFATASATAATLLLLLSLLLLLLASPGCARDGGGFPLSVPLAKRPIDACTIERQAHALRARHGAVARGPAPAPVPASSELGSVPKGGEDVDLVDFLDAQVCRKKRNERVMFYY